MEILGDLAVRDQISFCPHPGAQGLLPAGSRRDGTARRAPAPAPGIQGASCCVTLHVLYACSFDKNKSSCLQFALNYIKVSAALTAPLRNDLGRSWQMALGEPGISPCSGSSSGSWPAGRRPRPPSALPGPGTNFHLYRDPHFSPVCTQRSVLQCPLSLIQTPEAGTDPGMVPTRNCTTAPLPFLISFPSTTSLLSLPGRLHTPDHSHLSSPSPVTACSTQGGPCWGGH